MLCMVNKAEKIDKITFLFLFFFLLLFKASGITTKVIVIDLVPICYQDRALKMCSEYVGCKIELIFVKTEMTIFIDV